MENKIMKYYFLKVTYTPYYCKSINYNIVISESISDLMIRNHNKNSDKFVIEFYKEINESEYLSMKKLNPTNESYLDLLKKDYSKFYK